MKGKDFMKELSYIDPKFIQEGEFDTVSANVKSAYSHKKLLVLIPAACLLLSLAVTAYATNLFGIREMFNNPNRELPEAAEPYIQQESAAAEGEGWTCEITESLSDSATVMATVKIDGGDEYIIVPTDAIPEEDTLSNIGLSGDETLQEYADAQGKKLLLVGARITKVGDEEIGNASQLMQNISDSEMVILTKASKASASENAEAVCLVYALEAGSDEAQRVELPFTLNEAPAAEGEMVYRPVNANAVPGVTVGDMTVTETALGINIKMQETETDEEAYRNIMKVEIVGLSYSEGGAVLEDDGNWYFEANMCQGTLTDTLIVRYYDWDKQPIGEIEFQKVGT